MIAVPRLKFPSENTMLDGAKSPFQSMVAEMEGIPVPARVLQLLLVLDPVAVNVPPVTPEVPVQVSVPVKVKVADVAVPPNVRPGATTSCPAETVHAALPDASTT